MVIVIKLLFLFYTAFATQKLFLTYINKLLLKPFFPESKPNFML